MRPSIVTHHSSSRDLPTIQLPVASSERLRSIDAQVMETPGEPLLSKGRQIRAVLRKPVPKVLQYALPPPAASNLPLPLQSKYSAGSPRADEDDDGEKTPRPFATKQVAMPKVITPLNETKVAGRGPSSDLPLRDYSVPLLVTTPSNATTIPSSNLEKPLPSTMRVPPPTPEKINTFLASKGAPTTTSSRLGPPLVSSNMTISRSSSGRSAVSERSNTPTPELPSEGFKSAKSSITSTADPLETLRALAKQTEALHARFATLRSERHKLSSSIVGSLKEDRPGPQYTTTLIDQHLCLAAVSSSMDICFAKLKSLDCQKEEAVRLFVAQQTASVSVAASPSSVYSDAVCGSGISPEVALQLLPQRSMSHLRKDSATTGGPVGGWPTGSLAPPKRPNATRLPSSSLLHGPGEPPLRSRSIRIQGPKAEKILSLMQEAASDAAPASPDGMFLSSGRYTPPVRSERSPAIEVYIPPTSPFELMPPMGPAPSASLPGLPPLTGMSKTDGVANALRGLQALSSGETSPNISAGVRTPDGDERDSQELPMGLKSSRRGLLQTIQVFVDDEILDYYTNGMARQS